VLRRRLVPHDPDCAGDTALGVVVCQNGVRQVRECCFECGRRSNPYGKAELLAAGIDAASLEVVQDFRTEPCEVCGSRDGVELHHFACQSYEHRFRDFTKWPTPWLCRTCHAEWHRIVTPDLVAGNVTLGELGARRGTTVRELLDMVRDWITAKERAA
jgi:hypothetical protein